MASKRQTRGKKRGRRRGAAEIPRVRRLPTPLTPAQQNRYDLLRRNNIDQTSVEEHLRFRGVEHTRQGVGGVMRNRYVNEDVISMFNELTGATRLDAWPDLLQPGEDPADPTVRARMATARGIPEEELP